MKQIRLTKLSFGLRQKGGRTKFGPITSPRRGALVKKLYRFLDTKRSIATNTQGAIIIQHYLYDPNRSGLISLVSTLNAIVTYILAADYPKGQKKIYNLYKLKKKETMKKEKGWSNFIKNFALGTMLYNVEFFPGKGGQIARAAGNFAVLLRKEKKIKKRAIVKLRSGILRKISQNTIASIGVTSNHKYFLRNYKKAGTIRRYGIRPRVRPSMMNPVDHPMGGRTRGGCAPQNKNGLLSHGKKKIKNMKLTVKF